MTSIADLTAEIERLKAAIRLLGEIGNVCTHDTLGEICEGCRCPKGKRKNDKHR